MKQKIFIIGFNKTATRSLTKIMRYNNFRAFHWGSETAAERFKNNIKNKVPLLTGYENYDCYADNEELIHNFKLLDKQYPNSIFIYNIRAINDWICSRLNHMLSCGPLQYIKYYRMKKQLDGFSDKEIIQYWINDYNTHYTNVVTYFKNRSNFMIYDINKNTPQDLKKVLPSLKLMDKKPKITNPVLPASIGKWKNINNEFVFIKPNNANPIHTIKL